LSLILNRPAAHAPVPTNLTPDHETAPAESFHDLGLAPELVAVLGRLGISAPFPIQAMTIRDALAGRDVSGKARTGSGKTLAFGLPLVQLTGTAQKRRPQSLVLVPTRELANQVARALAPYARARGRRLLAIYGGASMVQQIKALHAGIDVVIATPGRLNDLLDQKEVSVADVAMVVLDEADQMADMGFLPQVRAILDRIPSQHQTLLFSATLDGSVGELARRYQHNPVVHEVPTDEVSVEALRQRFIGVEPAEKLGVAARICGAAARSIVFVRTKRGADNLARQLTARGVDAQPIHGALSQSRRERTLAAFASGRAPTLVATNLAARGIHVDGVDTVLHYDPPEDGKTYLHRSGRTARAGNDGLVVTLVCPDQERDARELQREAGVNLSIVPMKAADERLDDLASFEPPAAPPVQARVPDRSRSQGQFRPAPPRGGRTFRPRSGGSPQARQRTGGPGGSWRNPGQPDRRSS